MRSSDEQSAAWSAANVCDQTCYLAIGRIGSLSRACSVLADRGIRSDAAASLAGGARSISFLTLMTSPGSTSVVSSADNDGASVPHACDAD
jgi:hypothetical protein